MTASRRTTVDSRLPPAATTLLANGPESLCAALAGVADGVWDLDLRTATVAYNADWAALPGGACDGPTTGCRRAPWTALVHADDHAVVRAAMAAYLDGASGGYRAEHRVPDRDGVWRWVVSRGKVIARAPDGAALRVLGTVVDTSASKELARRLDVAERQHRALLRSLPDLIFLTRRDGTIVDYHAARAGLLALPPDAFVNRRIAEVLPADLARRSLELFATALDENRTLVHEYMLVVNGEPRHFEARIAPYDRDTVASLIRDVTDRVQAQQKIHRIEQRLHQAEKLHAIGQLASGIAHDFNNQMNSIIFLGDMLCKGAAEPDKVRRYADMMMRRAASSSELTQRLLRLARCQGVAPAAVDLHELVREVIALLQYTVDTSIRVSARLEAPAAWISADRSQVENALLNLAINARDAMPQGGELRFLTRCVELGPGHCRALDTEILPGRYLRVVVEDSGCGMDAPLVGRIFEPFFSTKPPGRGCGLGLSAVADTMRAQKGWIEVESTPGVGTRFALGFPLQAAPVPPAPTAVDTAPDTGAA